MNRSILEIFYKTKIYRMLNEEKAKYELMLDRTSNSDETFKAKIIIEEMEKLLKQMKEWEEKDYGLMQKR